MVKLNEFKLSLMKFFKLVEILQNDTKIAEVNNK